MFVFTATWDVATLGTVVFSIPSEFRLLCILHLFSVFYVTIAHLEEIKLVGDYSTTICDSPTLISSVSANLMSAFVGVLEIEVLLSVLHIPVLILHFLSMPCNRA